MGEPLPSDLGIHWDRNSRGGRHGSGWNTRPKPLPWGLQPRLSAAPLRTLLEVQAGDSGLPVDSTRLRAGS